MTLRQDAFVAITFMPLNKLFSGKAAPLASTGRKGADV